MPLQAEFDFRNSLAPQRQKVHQLQGLLAVLLAGFVFFLVDDTVFCVWLELILVLVYLRSKQCISMALPIERLVVKSNSAAAMIDGAHCPLATCGLDYCSSRVVLIKLTTMEGQVHRCFIFPDILGADKFRELIALFKAGLLESTPSTL
ncbi:hypothetical protein A9Q88_04800 [Gammaproteobacteria bacterium 50_400_T64]|nr:hypothetical protein A9Q88_04800 [Gammaproteobacteria bacterium 50_400_T64]